MLDQTSWIRSRNRLHRLPQRSRRACGGSVHRANVAGGCCPTPPLSTGHRACRRVPLNRRGRSSRRTSSCLSLARHRQKGPRRPVAEARPASSAPACGRSAGLRWAAERAVLRERQPPAQAPTPAETAATARLRPAWSGRPPLSQLAAEVEQPSWWSAWLFRPSWRPLATRPSVSTLLTSQPSATKPSVSTGSAPRRAARSRPTY